MKITDYKSKDVEWKTRTFTYYCSKCKTDRFTPMMEWSGVCCLCSWKQYKQENKL